MVGEYIDFDKANKFKEYIEKYYNESTYLFIDNSSRSLKSIIINKILRKYKLNHFVLYQSFININYFNKISITEKIKSYLDINKIKFKIVNSFSIKNYNIVFSAGTIKPLINAKSYININSTVCNIDSVNEKEENFCVFIDQGYPSHPDLLNRKGECMSKKDFVAMYNDFFDHIEKELECKVVIAKHPKSSVCDEYFNGRDVFLNQTSILIKKSKFIIAHHSHINNVAIQYHKPIILIYNDEMYKFSNNLIEHLNRLGQLLGLNLINITDKNRYEGVNLIVDSIKYNTFIDNYIIVDKKRNNHQIITDAILDDYNNK